MQTLSTSLTRATSKLARCLTAWLLVGAPGLQAETISTNPSHQVMEIIGHRGAAYDAPENTVAAIQEGFAQKADATEIDIWLTKDGQLAVIHDDDTKRTTGVAGKVKEKTFAELQQLDAGSWKSAAFAKEKIPSLEEVLSVIPIGKKLVIEIKDKEKSIVPALKSTLIHTKTTPASVILIGFDYETMKLAKEQLPEYQVLWLVSYKKDKQTGQVSPDLDEMILRAREAKLQGLNLASQWPIDSAFAKKVHDAGLKLYVWTVNDAALAKQLKEAGVDGITTDRPKWLRAMTSEE